MLLFCRAPGFLANNLLARGRRDMMMIRIRHHCPDLLLSTGRLSFLIFLQKLGGPKFVTQHERHLLPRI